jgi:hypothetical protein
MMTNTLAVLSSVQLVERISNVAQSAGRRSIKMAVATTCNVDVAIVLIGAKLKLFSRATKCMNIQTFPYGAALVPTARGLQD